jgi:hypothetical protein
MISCVLPISRFNFRHDVLAETLDVVVLNVSADHSLDERRSRRACALTNRAATSKSGSAFFDSGIVA